MKINKDKLLKKLTVLLGNDVPKQAQKLVADGLTKHTYFLMHRQGGKSKLVSNIMSTVMMMEEIKNPTCILVGAQLDQLRRIYIKQHITDTFGKEGGTFDSKNNIYFFPRELKEPDKARILLGEGNFKSKGFRGLTGHLLCGDEMGDWSEGFLETVFLPMGDHFNACGIYTGTPRGPNHFKRNFENAYKRMLQGDPDYFALKWTAEDSLRAGEITQEKFIGWQKVYSGELKWMWNTEYMLDFNASVPGRVFASNIETLRKNKGHIGFVKADPAKPVDTFWDVGVRGTAVWFRQESSFNHIYFKYLQQLENVNFQTFVKEKILPYIYQNGLKVRYNVFPHDMANKELMSEKTRIEIARGLLPGHSIVRPVPKKIDEAIDSVKRNFNRCYFNETDCYEGLVCLEMVAIKDNGKFNKETEAVKYTHGADAFILSETFDNVGKSFNSHNVMGLNMEEIEMSWKEAMSKWMNEMTLGDKRFYDPRGHGWRR